MGQTELPFSFLAVHFLNMYNSVKMFFVGVRFTAAEHIGRWEDGRWPGFLKDVKQGVGWDQGH